MKKNYNLLMTTVSVFAAFALLGAVANTALAQQITVKGTVADERGKGIAGVAVTDGFHTVATDAKGRYQLPADLSASRFVYISIPAGYEIPLHEEGNPLFYQKISSAGDKVKNFSLQRRKKPTDDYTVLVFADIQIRGNQPKDKNKYVTKLRDTIVPDVGKTVAEIGGECYALSLGDLVWDDLLLFATYKEQTRRMGIPVFNAIGNHDHDMKKTGDEASARTYEDSFGPANYSFNIGNIHYIMLDDVIYSGNKEYKAGLTDRVLAWLEQDLSFVKKGSTVVVSMHIPLNRNYSANSTGRFANFAKMMQLLDGYKVYMMAGHNHRTDVYIYPEAGNFTMQLWARTGGDLRTNSYYCQDGTPGGFGVLTVRGGDISWYHKTTGNSDRGYQMSAYSPKESGTGRVLANVWYWDPLWGPVEWWENGQKICEMTREAATDPAYAQEQLRITGKPGTYKTWHMFYAVPSPGVGSGVVKVTDRFGNKYERAVKW